MTNQPPKPAPIDWYAKPKPKPSKYKGISIVGTINGKPRYVSGDPNNEFNKYIWIRTKNGGYWRGLGPNKPTFNPDTGKPLEVEEAEKEEKKRQLRSKKTKKSTKTTTSKKRPSTKKKKNT